jgi:hypothetical protein
MSAHNALDQIRAKEYIVGTNAYPIPCLQGAIRRRNLGDSKGRKKKQGREWCNDSEEEHFTTKALRVVGLRLKGS